MTRQSTVYTQDNARTRRSYKDLDFCYALDKILNSTRKGLVYNVFLLYYGAVKKTYIVTHSRCFV